MHQVLVFVRSPCDMTVTEGEDAWFECQLEVSAPSRTSSSEPVETPLQSSISDPPVVQVCWYKDEDLIPADDDDFKQTFDGQTARLYISGIHQIT